MTPQVYCEIPVSDGLESLYDLLSDGIYFEIHIHQHVGPCLSRTEASASFKKILLGWINKVQHHWETFEDENLLFELIFK